MSADQDPAFDLVIVGGGCAGLSLATLLADAGEACPRVLIVERRAAYERDRTWCGWSSGSHRFSACADRSWSRWAVRAGGDTAIHAATDHVYEHIPSDAFYTEALAAIRANPRVRLELGAELVDVQERGDRVELALPNGPVTARTVVDTRPVPRPVRRAGDGAVLLQHFTGWEVELVAPLADPETVTLMDFDVDQEGGLHFMYVLPLGPRRALVESTVLSASVLPRDWYERRIETYVSERLGTSIARVEYSEAGAIPMYVGASAPGESAAGTIVRAGTAGGAVRASSGYAFHAIQRDAAHLAEQVLGGATELRPRARGGLDGWMDRVFLAFLERSPERAPDAFLRLAQGVEADVFARFMMERCRTLDRLRVVGCMPKVPFAREALAIACA
ncbi:MAG: lycopene cyclase family protein [Planctomycetota bacterium]